MTTIGPNAPSSASSQSGAGTRAWSNPTNALASDTSEATASVTNSLGTQWLWLTGFGFSGMSDGAVVTGITATVRRFASVANTGAVDNGVKLIVAGVVAGSSLGTSTGWPSSVAAATYGSSTTLWGLTLSGADIKDANFGIALSAIRPSGSSNVTVSIDSVTLTVDYTDIQTLTASGIASAETLGTATVVHGAVTLHPSGVASSEASGSPTVTAGAVSLSASGISGAEAFGTPTILAGGTHILPSGIASSETVGSASLSVGAVTVSASGIASGEASGSAALKNVSTLSVSGIASAEASGSATLSVGGVSLSPSGITSGEAVGTASVAPGAMHLSASGIASAEAVGTSQIIRLTNVTTTFLATTNSGTLHDASQATYSGARDTPTSVFLDSSNLSVGQATGYAVFETFVEFDTSSIPSDATVKSATLSLYGTTDLSTTDFTLQARLHDYGAVLDTTDWVAGSDLAALPLLASASTAGGWSTTSYNVFSENGTVFQQHVVVAGTTRIILVSDQTTNNVTPTDESRVNAKAPTSANPSTQWPRLVVSYTTAKQTVTASGIGSGEASGTASISTNTRFITASGIASGEACGSASVSPGSITLSPTGVSSGETLGSASVTPGPVALTASGITSGEAIGVASIIDIGAGISALGITSAEAFGSPSLTPGGVALSPSGIPSAESPGSASLLSLFRLHASGVGSAEASGLASLSVGGVGLSASGIASVEAFGTAHIGPGIIFITATGFGSAEAFGHSLLTPGGVGLTAVGIATLEALGNAVLSYRATIPAGLEWWIYLREPVFILDAWLMQEDTN